MHNCEEFRERIAEQIIDREDLTSDPAFQHELLICSGCSDFYADSCEMMAALSLVDASVPAGAGFAPRSDSRRKILWRYSNAGVAPAPTAESCNGRLPRRRCFWSQRAC